MEKVLVITKKDITALEIRAIKISKEAVIKITSQEKLVQANVMMTKLREAKKFIAEKKSSIISPLNLALKNSRELFRPIEEKINTAQDNLKAGILDYKHRVEEVLKLKQEKIEKKVESGEVSFEKGSQQIEKAETKVDNFKTRKIREVVITDEKKIPQEYWVINMVLLRKDVLAGKEVEGTKVVTKEIAL